VALKWIEGFDAYSDVNDTAIGPLLVRKGWSLAQSLWDHGSYYRVHDGHWGGKCLRLIEDDSYAMTPALTSDPTIIVGCSIKVDALTDRDNEGIIALQDGLAKGMNLRLMLDGSFALYRGDTFIQACSGTINPATWYYLEVKCYCHETVGYFEARLNRQVICTYTGNTDTANHVHDRVLWRGLYTPAYALSVDDIYVCDGSAARNNDFLGIQWVQALLPDSNGDQNDWTPSVGANYECVDDPASSAADYVESDTPNAVDLYGYPAVSGISGSLRGVQINTYVFSTADCVPWTMKDLCKSGATTQESDEKWVSSDLGEFETTVLETDPNTGDLWAQAALNDAQFGVKLVSTDP
jgi:hypothetical protein